MRKPILTLTGQLLGLALGASAVLALLLVGVGPGFGGYRTMTVLTGSMRPSMPEGSLIVQTPVPLEQIRVGDVISYRIPVDDHRVVTHRVVEVVAGGDQPVVRTKGDANAAPDPWVARLDGDRTWKVRFAVAKAGYVVQALRDPVAQRLSLFVVPAVLALVWLWHIWAPHDRTSPAPAGTEPHPSRASQPQVVHPWRFVLALAGLGALVVMDRSMRSAARRHVVRRNHV